MSSFVRAFEYSHTHDMTQLQNEMTSVI